MLYQNQIVRIWSATTLVQATVVHFASQLVFEHLRATIILIKRIKAGALESKFAVAVLLSLVQILLGSAAMAQQKMMTISEFVSSNGLNKGADSFLTSYSNPDQGTVFLEIPEVGKDLLYQSFLTSGFGSRYLVAQGSVDALDRGRYGQNGIVAFRRYGQKVLLINRNTNYYTSSSILDSSNDAALSYPNSVIGYFDVKAVENGNVLVDATNFFLRDGINIPAILKDAGQGSYSVDANRSAIDASHIHTTEDSVGVDALLTFATNDPAPDRDILGRVAADRSAVLVRERNMFIKLPDLRTTTFRPRIFDIGSGFFDNTYQDPIFLPYKSTRQSFIVRFALSKKDPTKDVSEPEQPIVYYIDPTVPQELHQMIVEAASWWNVAFKAAGFENAIQVKELPSGLDPFAPGVNIILWVPRETRGFSMGAVIDDPRTGQILKSVIRLDAMRIQADRVLFDALTSPYQEHPDFSSRDEALKRRFRLLVAHEMGHTLGIRHQYIGSAQGMSSVMDYPFPNISLESPFEPESAPLLRDVFPQGVGTWDMAAIFYGYHPFPIADEASALRAFIEKNERAGFYWMTDEDVADAHPLAQKWDQGTDPVAELEKVLETRRAALSRFSKYAIPKDEPLAVLQDVLAPLYLLHQFEVKAVGAMLGGYTYRYAMRDEAIPEPVPAASQRRALQALLVTLDSATLWPGQRVLGFMSPRQSSYPPSEEAFSGNTGRMFDEVRPVEDAVWLTMAEILNPRRAARLAQAKAHDPGALGIDEVLAEVVGRTWRAKLEVGPLGVAQRAIALTVLRALAACAASKDIAAEVRGACWVALDGIGNAIRARPTASDWVDADAFAARAISAAQGAGAELPKLRPPVLDPMGGLN
jgi:hypothetical protein